MIPIKCLVPLLWIKHSCCPVQHQYMPSLSQTAKKKRVVMFTTGYMRGDVLIHQKRKSNACLRQYKINFVNLCAKWHNSPIYQQ